MSIPRFSVQNPLTVNLLTFFAMVIGIVSCFTIQKEAFPPISFDMVTVRTTYPGASPSIVEKYVTIKIEDELKGVDGIDEMTSISAQNISLISLQLDPNLKNKRKVINDIQRAVDRVKDLPAEVDDNPLVTEIDAAKFPVITVSLGGMEYKDLQREAKILEDRLLNIDDVGSIQRLGYHDPEIWVEIDPDKAHLYHVSISDVMRVLRERNINLTGGELMNNNQEFNIRTNGEFDNAADVGKVIVRSNDQGKMIRVNDIANIYETFEDDDIQYETDGRPTINLMVVKKVSGDIIDMVEDIQEVVDQYKEDAPEELTTSYVDDMSYFVTRRLSVLVNNGSQGALLVLIFLFLVLAPPIAFTAAIDIPMTFLITVAIMKLLGISLNLMTMFGMIMVIGLLVDDAIIMAENVFRHIEKGEDIKSSAIAGGEEVMKPVLAAVMTSMCAYLPLAFMSGIIGQYVRSIPIIVVIALGVSLVTTLFAIPTHAAEFTAFYRHRMKDRDKHWFMAVRDSYMKVLRKAIDARYLVVAGITAFFAATICVAIFFMKFVLFSSDGMDEFFVKAETEIGTSTEQTLELMEPVQALLNDLPDEELENYVVEVGVNRERPWDPETIYGTNLAQIHVYLTPSVDRKRDAFAIMAQLEEQIKSIQGFKMIKIDKVRPGPPVGRAVDAKIRGDDFETIQRVVDEYKEFLKTLDGVQNVDDDFNEGRGEINIIVDREKAARAGLTFRDVAFEIRNAFKGGIATTIQKSDEEIDVRVKLSEKDMQSIDALEKVLVPNPRGNLIPLKQISTIDRSSSVSAIKRFDRKRMISVLADVDEDVTTSVQVNRELMSHFKDVRSKYPGIDVVYGGEQERTQESLLSLLIAFAAAMFLIFCIISIQFRSIIQPPIVMLTIPLGLLGVIWGLFLHGKPFSFMSIMGFIGLSGVVVNDSIVMIDFMNRLRRSGMDRRESILESCRARFRAITMASVTTVAGIMPMAYGWGGDDPFIRPMALAFAWGMAFASGITLFAIPCFYAIVDDISVKLFKHCTVKVPDATHTQTV